MKNKKRKFAALALCVTLLVGLLATTFSSADDFNAPEDPIVLAGADDMTNIDRIQSCYNSNLKTIVTNANLVTGATSFKILEILPGEATTTVEDTTFSIYVRSGRFASEVLVCDGVSVPADKVELTSVTAGTLCEKGDGIQKGSQEAILDYLLEFDLVYVNNTDDYDKTGSTPLADVEADTANMFFKTFDFTANGAEAFLTYITSESAPLLMDYNIYTYLNPVTLPGSSTIDPDITVNLNLAELAYTDFRTNRYSGYNLTSGHFVFPLNDSVLDTPDNILTYLTSTSNWPYMNNDETPVTGEVIDAAENEVSVESVAHYKFLEIVAQLPADGSKTPLQQLAEEEANIVETYYVPAVDENGDPILDADGNQIQYEAHPTINRLANAFLFNPNYGGEFEVEVCTPGSIPTDLSGYAAVFINIEESDYDTLLTNDITETEKALLAEYSSKYQSSRQYLYYEESIANTYDDSGSGNTTVLAEDYAYDIVKNVINTTTLQSKYSNVVLIDYLFLDDEGEGPDTGKISTIQAMINTAAYKGILPSSSDRKFNVLEIQPAAPIDFDYEGTADYTQGWQYLNGASAGYKSASHDQVQIEDRVYVSNDSATYGTEYYFAYKPQGNLKSDGSYDYDGEVKGVYTDGKGNYYFARKEAQDDFVMKSDLALLVQSASYAEQPVNNSNSSDLGLRPVYRTIEYRGNTYSYSKTKYSGDSGMNELVYTGSAGSIYINRDHVWINSTDVVSTFYDEMSPIGDPISYVSYKADVNGSTYTSWNFEYVLYKENVTLNDGVNPSGPYTMYVVPKTGYFLYEDAEGNLYVPNGYTKILYSHSRVNYGIQTETGVYNYHITKSKIADLIGIEESKINIDNYTVSELNCKVDDLVNTYDLIIIGGDVSALREFQCNVTTLNSYYARRMTVDSDHAYDMYFHTGDVLIKDDVYHDNARDNVPIGAQMNENGKYVFVVSGMDLSFTKQQELYNYIDSGRPVLIESEVVDADNTISTRIDPASYMGVMLQKIVAGKSTGGYQNILTGFNYKDTTVKDGKVVYSDETRTQIINTINCETSMIRPTLNIISAPIEYEDSLSKEDYAPNGHKFNVEYNIGSEAGNNMEYEVNLYFDVDMDGRFSEEEIYVTQSYRTGVDKNKMMEYELVDSFFGILSWKLEATSTNAAGAVTEVSQLGYAGYDKGTDQVEKLSVLQIVPSTSCHLAMCVKCDARTSVSSTCDHEFGILKYTGSRNEGNWMDEFVFKDYFDIDLDIMTSKKFCEEAYKNNAYIQGSSVVNENWLIDKYDMIVIGFADSYNSLDFTKVACAELIKFSEVNSLLCSHDNIGIVNSGAAYEEQPYTRFTKVEDPDSNGHYLDTSKAKNDRSGTDWSYNMSFYYNKSDPVYNSSVRYIYGAARFFTLDPDDPYTNNMDGSEFYTDYNIDYGPARAFLGGVFGGQTDVCVAWRHNSDPQSTSPYKNNFYNGTYNDTRKVRVTNDGIITRYPFALPESFTVDTTHSQYAQLDLDVESTTVWYCLDTSSHGEFSGYNPDQYYYRSFYTISPNDGRNSYYIYSNKNVTYTGAGHSDITPNFDNNYERKLFINTVFLSFNAMNNPPVIKVEGDNISTSDEVKINTPDTKVDAQATVSSTSSIFEYDLKVIDDLPDRYFTGYIYIDANPNGEGYDSKEDTLVGIIKYSKDSDGYIYYDLLKNGETRRMTDLQLKPEYFTGANSTTHLSLQIFDRFPYSMADVRDGNVPTAFYEQQSSKTLYSVYTIRINAQGVVDMNL